MVSRQLAPKAAQLLDKLVELSLHDAMVPELILKRIERDAHKAMEADPAHTHMVLGFIAMLQKDIQGVRRHYKIAVEQSGGRSETWYNYSVALGSIGYMEEAFKAAEEAYSRSPNKESVIIRYMQVALGTARLNVVKKLGDFRKKALTISNEEVDRDLTWMENVAKEMAEAIDRQAFSEEGVREVLGIVHEIRGAHGLREFETSIFLHPYEPDNFLLKFHVMVSPSMAVDLNEQVADRIVERAHLLEDPGLTFMATFIGTKTDVDIS